MGDLFELFEHDSILNEEENASIENFFVDHPEFMYDSKLGLVTGMHFSSLVVAYAFYQEHAKHAGFSIIRKSIMKLKDSNSLKYILYICDKVVEKSKSKSRLSGDYALPKLIA